eukprot:1138709-Pelagomonas_calceolata.AAC.1
MMLPKQRLYFVTFISPLGKVSAVQRMNTKSPTESTNLSGQTHAVKTPYLSLMHAASWLA